MASTPGTWRLIGGHQSPYVAKVRAYLRYRRIPFEEILPSKAFYKTVVVPKTGAAFIPVLHDTDQDVYVAESSAILDYCEDRLSNAPGFVNAASVHPAGSCQRLASFIIELFVDEGMMYSNRWANVVAGGENTSFLRAEWGQMMAPEERDPEKLEQILQRSVFGNAKAMAGAPLSADASAFLQGRFKEICETLDSHFRDHEYLLGSVPCWGDFALVGSLYNMCRDPYPGALIGRTYHYLRSYVERCHQSSVRPPDGFLATGFERRFLPDDYVPPGVLKLLGIFFEDTMPYVDACVKGAAAWKEKKGSAHQGALPRSFGVVSFSLGGVETKRGGPFHILLKLQRVLNALDAAHTTPLLDRFPNGRTLLRLRDDAERVRLEHEPGKFYKFRFAASKL